MKKIIVLTAVLTILLTGCFKRDSMEGITIYTTIYPIEFVVDRLYGDYSTIRNIYPKGVNVQLEPCIGNCPLYILTDKQLADYSSGDLFIFNSLLHEGTYIRPMLENNRNLKIINAADNLSLDGFYGLEEMWLDPSRLMTLARNIKNGFNEYVTNFYLRNNIQENFNQLREELAILDSRLTELTKRAENKTIVVGSDVFNFLSRPKYGLTVLSLDETDNLTERTIEQVRTSIRNGSIKYIYIRQHDEPNDTIKRLIEGTDVEIVRIHMLVNLTESEISGKRDYFTIMNENFELLRKSLYNH